MYASEAGRELALPIQAKLVGLTGDRDRGIKERNDLAVLNGTDMPAVLVETGFISHPETETKLKTPDYQYLLAEAIVAGINEFLGIS